MSLPAAGLSIGALADATGLGVETLRAWERRYGRPCPRRLPSGHRRYDAADVVRLRLVADAIGGGHRPADVARLDAAALERLVSTPARPADPAAAAVARWLGFVARLDPHGLDRALGVAYRRAPSPAAFLDEALGPFLVTMGRTWAAGRLSIRHEHLASEVVAALLMRWRAALPVPRRGPRFVLATLPGERHALGLGMAALVAAAAGARVELLGLDTPVEEVVATALEVDAHAVVLSVSAAAAGRPTERALAALRRELPPSVRVVVGGQGVAGPRRRRPGVDRVLAFAGLATWVAALRPTRA